MKYYIKATLKGGKSCYDNNFIYNEGYNCHPNPIRDNYICGEGRIHLANNIEIANIYVKNPKEYYLALPFEILAEDDEKIAVVDCWLWRIPNDIVIKYNKFKEPAKAEFERIKDHAKAEFERIKDQAWNEFKRIIEPAWAEYKRITDQAKAEFERIIEPAWADYERITDPAWNDYERITDLAQVEFERIREPAWNEYERIVDRAYKKIIKLLYSIIKANPAIKSYN